MHQYSSFSFMIENINDKNNKIADLHCVLTEDKVSLERGFYGKVAFNRYNVIGSFCDENFTSADATAICRSVNLEMGIPLNEDPFGKWGWNYPIWYRDFDCIGNETNVFDCPVAHTDGDVQDNKYCKDGRYYLGVICYNSTSPGKYKMCLLHYTISLNLKIR